MKINQNIKLKENRFSSLLRDFGCLILLLSLLVMPAAAQDRGVNVKPASGQTSEKRVALVIGNGSYQHADSLGNPANDAADMAQALRDLGFEVFSGTNQTKAQMQNLIRQFGNRLTDTKAVGLFFYAGHGISAGGTNYLVPVDADIQAEDEIEDSSVSINFLLGKMSTAGNGFNMVILDACRNNPFAKKWRNYRDIGDKGGLARIDAPTGTLIAYATRPGDVAADGDGRNGLYTGALLKQMRVKNLDVTKMLQYVRADVMRQSGNKQVPFDESSLVGDFSFAGSNAAGGVSNSQPPETKTGEAAFWQTIENSTDAADFESYLARSNSGEFSGIYKATAELKLSRLKKTAVALTWERLSGLARNLLKYDYVSPLTENLAWVRIGDFRTGKYGFIDKTGEEVIPLKYGHVGSFSQGLAYVSIAGKYGFIDKTGAEIVPLKYDFSLSFYENLAIVNIGGLNTGKWGFIDKTGTEVIPLKYDHASSFSEGLASVRIAGKYGFIDKTGAEVIPFKYDSGYLFTEGLAAVRIGDLTTGKYGFIDKTGKEVIPFKYDFPSKFSEGLAPVRIAGKWGFIDKTGTEIIPLKYGFASDFVEGRAAVNLSDLSAAGKWGIIDKTGREVIPTKYDSIWCVTFQKEGIYGVILNGKKGFVDIYGNEYFDF